MSTPNLPLRYEISNDGTGDSAELECICSTYMVEGGEDDNGVTRYVSTPDEIECNSTNDTYVIAGIRLKSTALGSNVKIKEVTIINTTADDFEYLLVVNPTVSNVTFTDLSNSTIQYCLGESSNPSLSTISGGYKLGGGFVKSGGSSGSINKEIDTALRLGSKVDGTRDEIYLCCRPLTTGANVRGGITVKEIV